MDYLQYRNVNSVARVFVNVLNLIINGLPSIQKKLKVLDLL